MKPQERIAELEKELAAATEREAKKDEQIAGLTKALAEAKTVASTGKGKSWTQAQKALELLKAGPVTVEQLKALNDKYPSDAIYYVRNLLKQDVKTVRLGKGNSVYMLPEQHATYLEGLAKEKAAKEASEKEAKEAIPPATTAQEAPEIAA